MWSPLLRHQCFSLIFTIFVVALGAGARGQSLTQCAVVGEYCQNHWDCCSNSCMTYLYRCMRRAPSYPQFYIEPLYPFGETSLDDLLDLNFGGSFRRPPTYETPQLPQLQNRFGIVENAPKPERLPLTKATTATAPAASSTQNVPTNLLSIILKPQQQQQQQQQQQEQQLSAEVAQRESAPNTLETLSAASVTAAERDSESGTVTSVPPCKPIGEKCYSNGECCTMRCHGFLHQCVT